jgi:Predicted integral membrane protein (DUF2269)
VDQSLFSALATAAPSVVLVASTHQVPTGVLYSVLLLAHVGCAVVGFGTVCATGVQAARARQGPGGEKADAVRRYFRPGPNFAARALYGVPVFGFSLIAASGGVFVASDGFVVAGLVLWLTATLVAEAIVWPGERRIQVVVSQGWETGHDFERDCRFVSLSALCLAVVFVGAVVVMVARP